MIQGPQEEWLVFCMWQRKSTTLFFVLEKEKIHYIIKSYSTWLCGCVFGAALPNNFSLSMALDWKLKKCSS
jgi:hypothetical protein